jgi:uncharacterized membrane protein YqjE
MNDTVTPLGEVKTLSKQLAKRALAIGENRLKLLLLEMEEERERLMQALLLALAMATFGLLAGVGLTVLVLLLFWNRSPILAMSVLTAVYAGMAVLFSLRLVQLRRDWEAFSGSLTQIRKDCSCLAEILR